MHYIITITTSIFIVSILGLPIIEEDAFDFNEKEDNNVFLESVLKSLSRQRRQSATNITSKIVENLVEGLVNTIKPTIGNQAIILEAFKPLFISFGSGIINESIKIMKNMMSQRPFFDFKLLKEKTYGVYPVFIPGYGSFILVSEMGMVEELKDKMANSSKNMLDIMDYKLKDNLNITTEAISNNTESNINNKTINEDDSLKNDNSSIKEEVNLVNLQTPRQFSEQAKFKPNEFDLGEAHLIPMVNEPNIFESSEGVKKSLLDIDDNNVIKQYLRHIMKGQKGIKSFKKRILLDVLKRLENAVYNL